MKKPPIVQGIYESKGPKISVTAKRDMLFRGGHALTDTSIKRGERIDVWIVAPTPSRGRGFALRFYFDVPSDPKKSSSATVGIMIPDEWLEITAPA